MAWTSPPPARRYSGSCRRSLSTSRRRSARASADDGSGGRSAAEADQHSEAAVNCIADSGRSATMSMEGPRGTDNRDLGAQRWGAEEEQIDKAAAQEHLAREAERIHAEEAA